MDSRTIVAVILAVVTLVVVQRELRLKRLLHEDQIKAQRQLQEQEFSFRRARHEEETRERHARAKWMEQEAARLGPLATDIATVVARELITDTTWASSAITRARIGHPSETIFADRLTQFSEEKEHLAHNFLPLLLKRCREHIEAGHPVYLIIDAGTTVYPLFSRLGTAAVRCLRNREEWVDRLTIVTNNLPGVQSLMDTGRTDPINRYSALAVRCELLPGAPLPVYSAVTGELTTDALNRIRERHEVEAVFIGVLAGNWIRLRRSDPISPIPLSRGQGHLEFKQALIDASDEVYVMAPLGKIFVGVSIEEINDALGFSALHSDTELHPYSEVLLTAETSRKIKLVSTSRLDHRVLSHLSQKLSALLDARSGDAYRWQGGDLIPHWLFEFDKLPQSRHEEIAVEFPHAYTRTVDFMQQFFFVPRP